VKIAEVFLNQTNKRIDTFYDYRIPADLAEQVVPGVRVTVTFGRGMRLLEGFVIRVKDASDFEESLKPICSVIDEKPVLTACQMALCSWMRDYYCARFYEVLGLFVNPVHVQKRSAAVKDGEVREDYAAYSVTQRVYSITEEGRGVSKTGPKMQGILDLLRTRDCTAAEIKALLGDVAASRRRLEEKGWITARSAAPEAPAAAGPLSEVHLDDESGALYSQYMHRAAPGIPVFFYIQDPEKRFDLYCRAIADCLAESGQAFLIYPEISISLENQTAFYTRFGDAGAIYHGKLTKRERYLLFERARAGSLKVVMGSRAALFLPLADPKLIIVDEPMDASYSAPAMPRFQTHTVAAAYARFAGARLITGGAVPSVADMQDARSGDLLLLGEAATDTGPVPELVDMQAEMRAGHLDFMSRSLRAKLEAAVAGGGRALLMLNRRGYATYAFCRSCGHVERCPACGVTLRVYGDKTLRCPYCGRKKPMTSRCPQCGSRRYQPMGLGIEQVTTILKERYPQWRILQIDGSSVRSYEAYEALKARIAQGQWDVITGTRILIRGFDFGSVALAGALLVDSELNLGDYTSGERTYQLYRRFFALSTGGAVLQTYDSQNTTAMALASGNFEDFWQGEWRYRKALGYPPAGHLVLFTLMGDEKNGLLDDAWALKKDLTEALKRASIQGGYTLYDPALSGTGREGSHARCKLLAKMKDLTAFTRAVQAVIAAGGIEGLAAKVGIEIDPPATI
jgi:primosomal protein N' (replication factor Y)